VQIQVLYSVLWPSSGEASLRVLIPLLCKSSLSRGLDHPNPFWRCEKWHVHKYFHFSLYHDVYIRNRTCLTTCTTSHPYLDSPLRVGSHPFIIPASDTFIFRACRSQHRYVTEVGHGSQFFGESRLVSRDNRSWWSATSCGASGKMGQWHGRYSDTVVCRSDDFVRTTEASSRQISGIMGHPHGIGE